MDKEHLNIYISPAIMEKIRQKAKIHGLSISGMGSLLIAKALSDSETRRQ